MEAAQNLASWKRSLAMLLTACGFFKEKLWFPRKKYIFSKEKLGLPRKKCGFSKRTMFFKEKLHFFSRKTHAFQRKNVFFSRKNCVLLRKFGNKALKPGYQGGLKHREKESKQCQRKNIPDVHPAPLIPALGGILRWRNRGQEIEVKNLRFRNWGLETENRKLRLMNWGLKNWDLEIEV